MSELFSSSGNVPCLLRGLGYAGVCMCQSSCKGTLTICTIFLYVNFVFNVSKCGSLVKDIHVKVFGGRVLIFAIYFEN